ncbi:hypothetical protein [Natronococcus occultus]|uniref:Uncharacterized protein n=1 Tax=Natronococcus occultus SP4 TaxID=694430 RepID=L0JXH8_9EURY|nr:hypothetical protein [Natronococcus occultus]AGB37010.1 hypothetical protein Natoc_1173 [Natronococcus occultus SP4]
MWGTLDSIQIRPDTRYAAGFVVGISAAVLAVCGALLYTGVHSGPTVQVYETGLRNVIRTLVGLYVIGLIAVIGLVVRDLPWSLAEHLRGGDV